MKKICIFLSVCFWLVAHHVQAQDDLLNLLSADSATTEYTQATFKSTRVINGHSVETTPRNHLDFRISHRFGRLNSGAYELWGLDAATIRFGLEYGITDRLMVGVGRSSNQKLYDGFTKFKLLRQSTGAATMPVTVVLFGSTAVNTLKTAPEENVSFQSRLSYCGQLLIARKFSDNFSLQLMPTVLHRNRSNFSGEDNTIVALGAAGRYKISRRVAFNAEYYAVLPNQINALYHNSLAIGFDLETGGHVFALHFTNSLGMVEKQFIAETEGQWGEGDIHYGFNISRTFSLNRKKKVSE